MGPVGRELLELLVRSVHVVAAIMWIGNSLLFNWLDRRLVQRADGRAGDASRGSIWLLHSGGFYHVEKSTAPGGSLPVPLHWFKWQAYTTWASGVGLLSIVYYSRGGAVLVDPGSGVTRPVAVAVSCGLLAAGWVMYDRLVAPALSRHGRAGAAAALVLCMAATFALDRVLTPRAAFLHVGALLGTLMAGNVAFRIMPAQRALVAAVAAGRTVDGELGALAKARSIHNNYMTFPVLLLMLSSHFPGLYGHDLNWLLLGILAAGAAGVRHVLNNRTTSRFWVASAGGAGLTALILTGIVAARPSGAALRPGPAVSALATTDAPVPFSVARSIVDRRCTVCHSAHPSDVTFGPSPGGIAFDLPQRIQGLAGQIAVQAVRARSMPLGNKTRITDEERALLGRWIRDGASLR